MYPEQTVVVTITEQGVSCSRPDGAVESVAWDDLQGVIIETTDTGPFAPDVFWVLVGEHGGCVIPQGATGEKELLNRLQALDGFDNEVLIQAMMSSENQRFLCWEKKTPAA
jgi:hypothetical protein